MVSERSGDKRSAPLRFLALGDSYTIGESVTESERWPVQLIQALESHGYAFAPPEVIAHTGWTTGELAVAIRSAGINPTYDLVSLLIGVNNQFRGYSRDDYQAEFADLLSLAVTFAGGEPGHVLVLSIPDWGTTPFAARLDREAISENIDAFNAVNRQKAERLGAHYIDVTRASREAANKPGLVAEDGLHPSGKMYTVWAEIILTAALGALADISMIERRKP